MISLAMLPTTHLRTHSLIKLGQLFRLVDARLH